MKISHVIVAIVFFILGAALVYCLGLPCGTPRVGFITEPKALHEAQKPGSSGFAIGGNVLGMKFSAKHETNTLAPAKPDAATVTFTIERDVNRQASDYRDFALAKGDDFPVCQKACEAEAKCKAFTYVKAGPRGDLPHCWLKQAVPAKSYKDDQCITGVRQ